MPAFEYVAERTGKVLDAFAGDRVSTFEYATGRARSVVEAITRRLPAEQHMRALADWSNAYAKIRRVEEVPRG